MNVDRLLERARELLDRLDRYAPDVVVVDPPDGTDDELAAWWSDELSRGLDPAKVDVSCLPHGAHGRLARAILAYEVATNEDPVEREAAAARLAEIRAEFAEWDARVAAAQQEVQRQQDNRLGRKPKAADTVGPGIPHAVSDAGGSLPPLAGQAAQPAPVPSPHEQEESPEARVARIQRQIGRDFGWNGFEDANDAQNVW
jgi:hypothetical protein